MYPFINILGKEIPSYGLMVVLGLVISNLLMLCKLNKIEHMDFLILEGYMLLGGLLGSKILYLIVSFRDIDWAKWNDLTYITSIINGGFVFYGGLIGGVIGYSLAGRIHNIQNREMLDRVIFGLPIAHGFGRIGCHMAGCCYGMEYEGLLAITYPNISFGPCGESCFPVQLLEAILLWVLAFVVYVATQKKSRLGPIGVYLVGYSIVRFFLEFLRGDKVRGVIGGISTSQIISVFLVLFVIGLVGIKKK